MSMSLYEQQCHLAALKFYNLRRKDGSIAIDEIPGPSTTMAIRNFQNDYGKRPDGSKLIVDGHFGPATEKALREVIGNNEKPSIKPAPVDSDVPTWWFKYSKWCHRKDWRCQCNGQYCTGFVYEPHEQTVAWVYQICEHFGKPYIRNSGLRCKKYNATIPGASPVSRHILGSAFDLHIDGINHKDLYDYADKLVGNKGGVGLYSWGIHIDDRGYWARW